MHGIDITYSIHHLLFTYIYKISKYFVSILTYNKGIEILCFESLTMFTRFLPSFSSSGLMFVFMVLCFGVGLCIDIVGVQ